VAEGRGGVVKQSFTTDLVSNLLPHSRRWTAHEGPSGDRARRDANHLSERTGHSRDAIPE